MRKICPQFILCDSLNCHYYKPTETDYRFIACMHLIAREKGLGVGINEGYVLKYLTNDKDIIELTEINDEPN